jgi:hypothetical protein
MRVLFDFVALFANYSIFGSTFTARVLEFGDLFGSFSFSFCSKTFTSFLANWNKNSCPFLLFFLHLFQLRPKHRKTPGSPLRRFRLDAVFSCHLVVSFELTTPHPDSLSFIPIV